MQKPLCHVQLAFSVWNTCSWSDTLMIPYDTMGLGLGPARLNPGFSLEATLAFHLAPTLGQIGDPTAPCTSPKDLPWQHIMHVRAKGFTSFQNLRVPGCKRRRRGAWSPPTTVGDVGHVYKSTSKNSRSSPGTSILVASASKTAASARSAAWHCLVPVAVLPSRLSRVALGSRSYCVPRERERDIYIYIH